MAAIYRSCGYPWTGGNRFNRISRDTWQRQGPFATAFCRPGWNTTGASLAAVEAAGHSNVYAQRRARRAVYAISHFWSFTRRCLGASLEHILARCADGIFCSAGRWGGSVRYYSRPDLGGSPGDGAYWQGSVIRFAINADRRHLNTYRPID